VPSPFLVSYGGGHANILSNIYQSLYLRGHDPTLLGLTTAHKLFKDLGFNTLSISQLCQNIGTPILDIAKNHIQSESHPDIHPSDTLAYYSIGLQDLISQYGLEKSLSLLKEQGRKSFLPIDFFRSVFKHYKPSIVVTTTSPRFELAALRAAYLEDIPSVAIGDLFLHKESEWISQSPYANKICVLCDHVRDYLVQLGIPESTIAVTGNPSFDTLSTSNHSASHLLSLREKYNLGTKKIILCPLPPVPVAMNGQSFTSPSYIQHLLDNFCSYNPDFSYILRCHPNDSSFSPKQSAHGLIDDTTLLSSTESINLSEYIIVEASTMGLEAALLSKKVLCVGFSDYVVYPHLGAAVSASTYEHALSLIKASAVPLPSLRGFPTLGCATMNVISQIESIPILSSKQASQ